jgi:hypothetical protein
VTAPQPHQNRLKIISFTLAGVEFSTQITSWKLSAGIKDGDRIYTYSSSGEGHNSFIEQTDGEPTLEIKFLSDWRSAGVSDYLWSNNMTQVAFTLDHHPDIVGEHVQFSGQVLLYAPDLGDDARVTESQDVTFPIVGTLPTYTRIG